LQELDDIRRKQLEEGDWEASPDSRFRIEDARYYRRRGDDYVELNGVPYYYKSLKIFGTTDIAGTVKQGLIDQDVTKNGPSYTVISIWGLTPDYHLLWLYMRRFRDEIPKVVDNIYDVYKIFKPEYMKIENNGVGLGAYQLAALKGVPVKENFKATDKFQNATNALYRMSKNRIWFPEEASWLKECTDEVFSWTGHPGMTDDIVDTLSDACNDITWDANNADPVFHDQSGLQYNTGPAIVGLDGQPYKGLYNPFTGGGFDNYFYF
jgi:phage terminase large subunit-like protein